MGKKFIIDNRYNSFKKKISVDGDKSISIRTLLLASQAHGKTFIKNILLSEDILNAISCLKKLGIKNLYIIGSTEREIKMKQEGINLIYLDIDGWKSFR